MFVLLMFHVPTVVYDFLASEFLFLPGNFCLLAETVLICGKAYSFHEMGNGVKILWQMLLNYNSH